MHCVHQWGLTKVLHYIYLISLHYIYPRTLAEIMFRIFWNLYCLQHVCSCGSGLLLTWISKHVAMFLVVLCITEPKQLIRLWSKELPHCRHVSNSQVYSEINVKTYSLKSAWALWIWNDDNMSHHCKCPPHYKCQLWNHDFKVSCQISSLCAGTPLRAVCPWIVHQDSPPPIALMRS